ENSSPRTFKAPTTSVPGTWNGATRTMAALNFGDVASLEVRAWDSRAGSTWEQAVAGGFGDAQRGTSEIFTYLVPQGNCLPPTCFFMDNFRGFMLVPEPSTVALVLLGIAGIWGLRGRR